MPLKRNWRDRAGQNNHGRLDQIMLRDSQTGLYHEEYFNELLALEKKRCERSKDPVCLITADLSSFVDIQERQKIAKSMADVLSNATRDTDIKGWHVDGLIVGIIFTEMAGKEVTSRFAQVVNKCVGRLGSHLGAERLSRIQISWQGSGNGKWERPLNYGFGSLLGTR
jgi:hypothetical protein